MVSKIKNTIIEFKYMFFNKKYFKNHDNYKKGIILVELFNYKASIISVSFFVKAFCSLYKTDIVGFEPLNFSIKKKIKFFLNKFNFNNFYKLYSSFGVNKVIIPKVTKDQISLYRNKKIIKKIKSKKSILNFKIKNIKIGDLVYDTYLRNKNLSSIDYQTEDFQKYFFDVINLFYYWDDFFDKNNVKALVVSHTVYTLALPARIALHKKIKVYNVGAASCYKLSKDKPLRWSNFGSYVKFFNSLKKTEQKKAIQIAKKNLSSRFKGKDDILYQRGNKMSHVFKKEKIKKKIFKTDKKKIIIAAHNFNDAPHVHGKMLFADFSDWIKYLGKKSEKIKEYEWCIKLHPSDFKDNEIFIENILKNFKRLTFLPKNSTHIEILKEKVVAALTVYGSIGHEYPLFNIPVINAGYGPHYHYKFNFNPTTLKQYDSLLNNLDKLKVKKTTLIDIYKFYFSHYFVDYEIFKKLPKKDNILNSSYIFKYFLENYNLMKIKKIEMDYKNFIISNKRRMMEVLL